MSVGDPVQVLLDLALAPDGEMFARIEPLARELLGQLEPGDAAEKMLVAQMIASFGRSMFLARHANRQKNVKWFALYSAECDRTMNLYRKQMQSLAEYRRPRRTTFNSIRTANIAGQQVVMGGVARTSLRRKDARVQGVQTFTETQAALSADRRGESGAARRGPKDKALGT